MHGNATARRSTNTPDYRMYTTAEVHELFPTITLRQLQWWDERKILRVHRYTRNRKYSTDDVLVIAILAELRSRGLSLQRIKPIIARLQFEIKRRLARLLSTGQHPYVLTDCASVWMETDPARIVGLLSGARRPIHVINVSERANILTVTRLN